MTRHGGQILVDQLKLRGVNRVFSVPGESFLAALDALHDAGIQNIVCRQEGGAAMMAEADGKLTGQPGILFVTRGPGATNAAAGLHVAHQDSTPMICFVGQIGRGDRDREAFQEVDFRAMFGTVVKWVAEIDDTARLPEYIDRAWRMALSGRPGPVVLSLPEDMLSAQADVPDRPARTLGTDADYSAFAAQAMELLAGAERPLVVIGGSAWSPQANRDIARFAEAANLPVAAAFRRQDYMDNRHSHYVGDLGVGMNPALGKELAAADVILALGTRLGDCVTAGYSLLDPATFNATLIHVHPDPDEPGHVYPPTLSLAAPAARVLEALTEAAAPHSGTDRLRDLRAGFEAWQTPRETPGDVKQEEVIRWLSANLPEDAIVTNGAGNYAAWLHRYFTFKRYGTQLAPTSGSMGYGFPAAIAAKLRHPDRDVVCMAGDGCFQMTLNELSTAAQHGAAVITVVINNGRYGTIRMHQERTYPGRPSGTDLANPDFAALARAYGGHGEAVVRSQDFPAAFERARASGLPAVIELMVDAEALTPGQTLTQARAMGEAKA